MVDGFKDLAGAGEGAGCVEAFDKHANPLDDHLGIERREETGKGQGRKGTGRDGKGRDGKGRDGRRNGRREREREWQRESVNSCKSNTRMQYTIYNMRYSV